MQIQASPLFALWRCQSKAWVKEEGDTKHLRYDIVPLNSNYHAAPDQFKNPLGNPYNRLLLYAADMEAFCIYSET